MVNWNNTVHPLVQCYPFELSESEDELGITEAIAKIEKEEYIVKRHQINKCVVLTNIVYLLTDDDD